MTLTQYEQSSRALQIGLFCIQQLALLPAYAHVCLAYVFFEYIVQGRTATILEKKAKGIIFWSFLGIFALTVAIACILFFLPHYFRRHQVSDSDYDDDDDDDDHTMATIKAVSR